MQYMIIKGYKIRVVCERDLLNVRLKPYFEYKITFLIFDLVLWIFKDYLILYSESWFEMFILKLSGIQKILYM